MTGEHDQIKEHVRQRYGERARRVGARTLLNVLDASCCSTEDTSLGAYTDLYAQGELEDLPLEAVAASAGCGNPTALAGLQPGERVLDLGSGGGIDCFLAARQVGPQGHVMGLDMTSDMVALARRNAQRMGVSNVEFLQGEMERIPLPDASTDVVISNCVVCLSPDKDAVFRETFRVLAPGGRVHISDMMAIREMPEEVRTDPEKWASCVAGADERAVYLDRLARAGFVDIAITGESCVPPAEEGDQEFLASVKVVAWKPREQVG